MSKNPDEVYYELAEHTSRFSRPVRKVVEQDYLPLLCYLKKNSLRDRFPDFVSGTHHLFFGDPAQAVVWLAGITEAIPLNHVEQRLRLERLIEEAERAKGYCDL